jgi:GntR family phosphonate transport system transcriptional regulator
MNPVYGVDNEAVASAMLSRQHGPRYQQLAWQLRQVVATYRAGTYLPAEKELAALYGVNRHTLRRAVDVLIDDGLVLRHKGKGTCVLERPIVYPVTAASTYSQALRSQGFEPQARLLGRRLRQARSYEESALQLDCDAQVFELRTLRLLDGQPMTLITHCFAAHYAYLFEDYRDGSVREHLKREGWELNRTSTHIGAQMPSVRDALLLMMPRQIPLLSIRTVSCSPQGKPLELSISLSRADRFQYHVNSGDKNEF